MALAQFNDGHVKVTRGETFEDIRAGLEESLAESIRDKDLKRQYRVRVALGVIPVMHEIINEMIKHHAMPQSMATVGLGDVFGALASAIGSHAIYTGVEPENRDAVLTHIIKLFSDSFSIATHDTFRAFDELIVREKAGVQGNA